MEAFIVIDDMVLGRGVFGIFSTAEKARTYKDEFEARTAIKCEVRQISIVGPCASPNAVLAASGYDQIHDWHIFEGLYGEMPLARDAVGAKGLVVEFVIDAPEKKQIR